MPKILIQKGKKEFIKELDREVLTIKPKEYYVKNDNEDYSTSQGLICKKDLKKEGELIKSKIGKDFVVFSSRFIDDYKRLRKLPQTIPLKDVGLIIAETGINKDSRVLDSGTGSGALTFMLANFAKEIFSYEIREDHYKTAEENMKLLKLTNIKLMLKDINEGIDEKELDLITLDLPEPWKAVNRCTNALKIGGFIVCYSITIPQLQEFVNEVLKEERLLYIKTVEVQEREWEVEGRRVRPKTTRIGHSGFLTFARRILR